jgi:hypothetical protein
MRWKEKTGVSAIGSYAVIRRDEWSGLLASARSIRTETTGAQEFGDTWRAAAVRQEESRPSSL